MLSWKKMNQRDSFNVASTTDGATFRFQALKDSLIAWELVWLSVPNFYASGKILAQDRAKLYRRGRRREEASACEGCLKYVLRKLLQSENLFGFFLVFWGGVIFFFFFQYLSSSDRELTALIRPARTSHREGRRLAGSIFHQDTDAPIAPFV